MAAIRIDHFIVQYKRHGFKDGFLFLIGLFTFVDAQPELDVALSASAYLDFPDAQHGGGAVFLIQQALKLLDSFR